MKSSVNIVSLEANLFLHFVTSSNFDANTMVV